MFLPSLSKAQIDIQEDDIGFDIIPNNPQPYQNVTIKLTSYATDLNLAMIRWQSGSKVVLAGYGKTSYSFRTDAANTITAFSVEITPSGSTAKIIKNIGINPSEVEILWEAVDGYTPPFYRGKSFVSKEGTIKAVAIPIAGPSSVKNISYSWKADNNSIESASGYNKDSYVFKNNVLNLNENISVTATSVDGQYAATGKVEIPIISPKIIFYKKSPTEGVLYNNALTDETDLIEDEITIVAEPYFLAIKGNEKFFNYSWKINNEDIKTPQQKTELTIHPESRGGYATIDFGLNNLSSLFQEVSARLKINL